jgi:hypothetical protein
MKTRATSWRPTTRPKALICRGAREAAFHAARRCVVIGITRQPEKPERRAFAPAS